MCVCVCVCAFVCVCGHNVHVNCLREVLSDTCVTIHHAQMCVRCPSASSLLHACVFLLNLRMYTCGEVLKVCEQTMPSIKRRLEYTCVLEQGRHPFDRKPRIYPITQRQGCRVLHTYIYIYVYIYTRLSNYQLDFEVYLTYLILWRVVSEAGQ